MDLLNNLMLGFGVAFTAQNLLYAFGGAVLVWIMFCSYMMQNNRRYYMWLVAAMLTVLMPIYSAEQPARAIPGVRLGPTRATVVQVDQGFAAQLDDFVAAMAFHVHDEGDATGVVFEARVVQALPHWCV